MVCKSRRCLFSAGSRRGAGAGLRRIKPWWGWAPGGTHAEPPQRCMRSHQELRPCINVLVTPWGTAPSAVSPAPACGLPISALSLLFPAPVRTWLQGFVVSLGGLGAAAAVPVHTTALLCAGGFSLPPGASLKHSPAVAACARGGRGGAGGGSVQET